MSRSNEAFEMQLVAQARERAARLSFLVRRLRKAANDVMSPPVPHLADNYVPCCGRLSKRRRGAVNEPREPRVSDARLAEIVPDTAGPCLPIGLPEAHLIAADLREARAALAASEARCTALVEALRHLQWHHRDAQGRDHCPSCGVLEEFGHMPTCLVGRALADSDAAAQAWEQKIRAEERERCAEVAEQDVVIEQHVHGGEGARTLIRAASEMAATLTRKSIAKGIRALGSERADPEVST